MTLPVAPDVETILDSCIESLRDIVAPSVDGEWPRYSAELVVGSLEYVKHLLSEDLNEGRRVELQGAVDEAREILAGETAPQWAEALAEASPFEAASKLLVACQDIGGDTADKVRATLHPILRGQLDAEFGRTIGLFSAFARNMAGSQ